MKIRLFFKSKANVQPKQRKKAYCIGKALPPQMLAPDLKCGPEFRTLFMQTHEETYNFIPKSVLPITYHY
jgi:hypothetical protein